MNDQQARLVRKLKVDQNCSYPTVARKFYSEFGSGVSYNSFLEPFIPVLMTTASPSNVLLVSINASSNVQPRST